MNEKPFYQCCCKCVSMKGVFNSLLELIFVIS